MGILGSVTRYLRTYGRLMYADPHGFGTSASLRRKNKKKAARTAYLEMLEPRVLMTTVYGGDAFQYTDALGNTVTATLNGNVIAELVSAVQVGGTSGKNVTATGGYLMFGDIAGKFTAGPRAGIIVGNGSIPINNGTQGSATQGNARAHIVVPGDNYPNLNANPALTGNQVVLQTLATNAAGQAYTFNIFDVQNNGSLTISPLDPSSKAQDFTMQVIQLNTSGSSNTTAGTVVYTVDSDGVGSLLPTLGTPPGSDTTNTYTYTDVAVKASAFNPIDNKLYFDMHYVLTFTPGSTGGGGGGGGSTASVVTYMDELFSFNPANSASGFTDVGAINVAPNGNGVPGEAVTGMAFTLNATAPTMATMFVSEDPTATGLANRPPLQSRLISYNVASTGAVTIATVVSNVNLWEGYGGQRSQLSGIVGLTVMPGSQDGGGDGFLFAVVNNGASSHVARIDLAALNGTANATAWGSTTDLYETTAKKPAAPYDGQSLTGLSYNPTLVDPFTGQLGVFMSIDTATTNLDFINHKLRINAGDVYSVYSATSDINSSITFQGTSLYTGNAGNVGGTATPANTGTVFIGYKGQIPDNSTNETFAASTPFLSGQITGSIGVMPGLIADTTIPTLAGAPTDKLFPGLDVARSLQVTFNGTASILSQVLGDAFNNVSGLAISPDQQIAVVNSFYYNGAGGDQLAFVNATSGMIDAASAVQDVVLNNTASTPLKNLEALAYGDPNLDGTSELYAVYDLGDGKGPTLGTLDTTGVNAVFTPIKALGLGAHGKVSSIAFSPGGTTGDPTHEALYVVADPNAWDFDGTQYLYRVNMTFSGAALSNVLVANRPTYDANGNIVTSGGIGPIQDSSGNNLKVVSMVFDATGGPLVLDRLTGRLEDLNLTSGVAGANFLSGVGQINPTVSGVALDPVTLKFFVVDNLTGTTAALTQANTDSTPISASSIMMQLKDFTATNASATSLGKFMVDGTITGKITVPGSMDMLYAGWFMNGDASGGSTSGSWIIPSGVTWAPTTTNATSSTTTLVTQDTVANENYFKDNIYIGGDVRSIIALTDIGTNGVLPATQAGVITSEIPGGLTGLEITVGGKIGVVYAKGTVAGVVHAGNQTYAPGLVDSTPVVFESSTDAYGFTFRGSATGASGLLDLTTGLASQAGSVFSNNAQPIDSFTASYTTVVSAATTNTGTSIDGGYAFVVQNQGLPALGSAGTGLGYKGILHSAGLGFFYDPTTGLMNMQLLNNGATVGAATSLGSISSTGTLNVSLTYSNNTLLVALANGATFNLTASYAINLSAILGSHAGYVGFTGSTGTQNSTTEIQTFIFNGSTPGTTQLAQTDIQHYNVDADFTFAAGYLTANGTNAPFSNTSFATAQYLGSVRNAAAGQPDTIHLQGVVEDTQPGNNPPTINQFVDYYSFSLLAGQTVTVNVVPRTELNPNLTSNPTTLNYAIFDPDGHMIASDLNWYNLTDTLNRAITFTADRPGAYRVAITPDLNNRTFANSGQYIGNITYDLTIQNAGNFGIGAVYAGGQVVLEGSTWISTSTQNTGSAIINHSIWADSGDVGLIQAGAGGTATTINQSVVSNVFSTGLTTLSFANGYGYTGTSSQDIFVPSGNLRALVGGQLGAVIPQTNSVSGSPDIYVTGNVGLVQTQSGSPVMYVEFGKAAGGNIQVVSAGGVIESIIRSNQAIGVIRANGVDGNSAFQVDADRTGADGVIDLIDDAGNWGGSYFNEGLTLGAPIISGPGGNIRFMRIGGTMYQDPIFQPNTAVTNNGAIVHAAGAWGFTDDSGASITLTPSTVTTAATTGTVTTVGVLTTRTYGIRGAGGVVLVDATSTTGLTVSVAPGGTGRNIGDVGTLIVQGTGIGPTVVNGVPTITTTATTAGQTSVILTSGGGAVLNALDIQGGTLDQISNLTNGDIYDVEAGAVGMIISKGNLGSVTNTTGAALIPYNPTFGGGAFDASQYAGISIGNVALVQAAKSIGNLLIAGVAGTITADAGGGSAPGQFYGLTGLVDITGSAAQTTSINTVVNGVATTSTVTTNVSVSNINIGQGIAFQGSATNPHTGVTVAAKIMHLNGTNADIRGNISASEIGTITLVNGSLVNVHVSAANGTAQTNFDNPSYVIDLIDVQGSGVIIGSEISAQNIRLIRAGSGVLNTQFFAGSDLGTLGTITAGGYGIIQVSMDYGHVVSLSANASGVALPLTAMESTLRPSLNNVIDPNTNAAPNELSDISFYLLGDGIVTTGTPYGLTTGVIGETTASGKDGINAISAYDIRDSSFNFPIFAGAINARHNVDDVEIISGNVSSIYVTGDATNFDVSAAGQIGPVFIGGTFANGTNATYATFSQIQAKGANGNITSFVDRGLFAGILLAEGSLGSAAIGTAPTKTTSGTGDMAGTITVAGNHLTTSAINSLTVYGSIITGGLLDLTGQIGTVSVGGSIAADAQPVTIRGNVTNLLIGADALVSGSDLANTLTITGNLANAIITGKMSGALIVQGNIGKFALNTDPLTVGTTPFTGSISAGGTLSNAIIQGSASGNIVAAVLNGVTIGGDLSGNLVGGKSITSATINGNILSGATVSSLLGDIKLLTVKGNISGSILANAGAISTLSFTGAIGATGVISAQSLGAITVPGAIAGTINATNALASLKAGSVASTASITVGSLAALTTTGDLNGMLNIGDTAAVKAAVGGNFGGQLNVQAPLTMTVGGNMLAGAAITDSNALTSLTVKGSLAGSIIVDRLVGAIAAGSVANAVIAAGQGLNSLKVTGLMSNTLVEVGLSRGEDNVFGTNDLNEQARMGDLGTLSVGTMNNSIVAVGGNIGTFSATGNMSQSSVSAGLVLSGASIAAVLADATPLATTGEIGAALQGSTLLHGSINSASVGKAGTVSATLIASSITAGVSPGADGVFGTADDNVNTSLTGGTSLIGSFKGVLDGASHLEANALKTAIPGLTLVNYTTGAGSNTILAADPISGTPTLVVTPTTPGTITIGGNTIVVKVTGPAGTTVSLYDNPATADRLDTLLISSTASGSVSVTVTTSDPNALALGRVIATDNTQVANFTFNGDILGDATGGPAVWIDSDMASFTARNLPNDGTWNGVIGGNVSKLTLNQMGPGKLRVGGRIATLGVTSSVGNPLLQQLGVVNPATAITQIAYNPLSGQVYASDGANLLQVDVNTGSISGSNAIHTLLTNASVSLSGLAFDAAGNLFGVATLNNQNPFDQLGQITTTGDTLRGLAVSAAGVIYAIDSQTGVDQLVTLDATSGIETVLGTIRDSSADTFTNNIQALAFDTTGNLLALTNDRDGNGGVKGTSNGYAIGKIDIATLRISSPLTLGAAGTPIILNGTVTHSLTAMAVDAGGNIYVVENMGGGVQRLDTLTLGATSTLTAVGNIKLGAANTSLVGIGVDETGALIGMNRNGTNSELIGISTADPTLSVRLDAPGLLTTSLAGFAVGKSGNNFLTYGFTTNATAGGLLFVSPGLTATLGSIATTGAFTQLLPLARNGTGAPLLGNVTGVAVDANGNIFAVSDQGVLAEYNSVNGSLIGGTPIGTVKDSLGAALAITRIAFNANGELIGLSASGNNLVHIGTTSTLQGGVNIALASSITDLGTTDATDLTALSFASGLGKVLSYSTASGRFVDLLGTSPATVGGIVANSFGSVSLPDAFTGRLLATGGGGTVVQGIDSIKLVGTTGTFTGNISAVNSIGSISGTGVTFNGSIISHADIASVALTGSVGIGGVLSADTLFKSFSLTGNFDGRLLAQSATTFAIKGSVLADALIAVTDNLATLTVSGSDSGMISLGTSKTLAVTGQLMSGAAVNILGPAGAITVSGGTQLGSTLLANDLAATVTIGGTLAGVVAVRKSVTTATLANVSSGIFAIGGDLANLNVTGSVSSSILAAGVWVGADGVYNTADDVIYGGTIANAKIGGVFTDSLITAGVLPPVGVNAGTNNIPLNFTVYDYNALASSTANIDGAQGGGIGASYIQNIAFAKPVVSSNALAGAFAALVAADGIGKVTTPANTINLKQIVRNDPPGAPTIVSSVDPVSLVVSPGVVRFTNGEIRITFNQPLDTSTINASTFQVTDSATGTPVTDLTFGYFQQTAADGSTQSVVQLLSASGFNGYTGVNVVIVGSLTAPTVAGRSGMRSALLAYPNDPFGVTFRGGSFTVGPPANDNQANAIVLTGLPVGAQGTNVNATVETTESSHGGQTAASSVWWTWTSPISGAVEVTTASSNFNTTLSVYSNDTTNGLISVGESTNATGTSTVDFTATVGTQYFVAVDGSSVSGTTSTGHIVLTIQTPPPPANDNLASAIALSGGTVLVSGNNLAATAQAGEPAHAGTAASHSVWYTWTAPSTGTFNINSQGSAFTAGLSVYTGTGASFASLTSVGQGTGSLTLSAVSGTTYHIALDTRTGAVGKFNLGIASTAAPANDNFAGASTYLGFPITGLVGNSLFATMEAGEPSNLGATQTTHSVWFNWVSNVTGIVTFDTIGSTFDTTLGVYSGNTLTSLTLLAADDQSGGNNTSLLTLSVVAGQTYRISVSSWLTTTGGNILLNIH